MFAAQVVDDLSDTEALVQSSNTFDNGQLLNSVGLEKKRLILRLSCTFCLKKTMVLVSNTTRTFKQRTHTLKSMMAI
jgi:hypothetical protein